MADEEVVAPPVEEEAPKVELPRPFPRVGSGVVYVRDDYSHLEEGGYPSEEVAAGVIAAFEDGSVTLSANGATVSPVGFDKGGAVGTWHWPEPEKKA